MTAASSPSSTFRSTLQTVLLVVIGFSVIAFALYIVTQQLPTDEPTFQSQFKLTDPAPAVLALAPDSVLFQDNFNNTQVGWELSLAQQAQYLQGAMVLNDNIYEDYAWAKPNLGFEDFILEAHTRWLSGSFGGAYGFHFRVQNDINYYAFYLHNEGRYVIGKMNQGNWFVVAEGFSPAIDRNGGINQLRVEANNNLMRFFVNNTYIGDVETAEETSGDFRLVAQKPEGAESFQVAFDNVVVALYPSTTE
jgi:hypothetical protein